MNFPILQEVVRYSREKLNGKDVSFALVSNLSLVTEEVADWIAENNISVSTSLDGPKFLHDLQRPRKDRDSSYRTGTPASAESLCWCDSDDNAGRAPICP